MCSGSWFIISFFLSFYPQDFKNALGFEVLLSVREHLEACCFVPAEGFVYWTAGGTPACLIWEVRHHVARTGQRLWRLSFYQKVQIQEALTSSLLIYIIVYVRSSLLWLFCFYSTSPDNLSIQEFQKNEAVDVEVNTPSEHPVKQHVLFSPHKCRYAVNKSMGSLQQN